MPRLRRHRKALAIAAVTLFTLALLLLTFWHDVERFLVSAGLGYAAWKVLRHRYLPPRRK